MGTRKVMGGAFSPDEKSIAFTTNASGVFNVYRMPITGGLAEQLTNSSTDNVYALSYLPDGERLLVSRERGGNENYHLWVLEPGGDFLDLTPGENVTARFFGPTSDGSAFYCATNERDRYYFDIYKMNGVSLERELLFTDSHGYDFGCVSRDGRYLALAEPRTRESSDIFVYDTITAEMRQLTSHEGDGCFWPSCFDGDAEYLYYRTNRNRDFYYVERIELGTGRIEQVVKDDCDCYISISPDGKYQVITRDRDTLFQIEVSSLESGEQIALPRFPGEAIAGFNFSRSARLLGFYVKGDCRPGDLYIHDFSSRVTRKLASSLTDEIDPDDLVDSQIVSYRSFDGLEIPSLLWKPHDASSLNKVPALVYIHGGPGGQARKAYNGTIQFLVNRGYAVLAPNYRGSSGHGKTFYALDNGKHAQEPLRDCIEAGRYLAALGWVESSKVAIMGASYGGFLTLSALAFYPHAFAAGIDLFGPTNWQRTLESFPPYWKSSLADFYRKLGDPGTDGEMLRKISPLFHADAIVKPLLVLQGANDPRVLQSESDEIVEAIRKKNGIVEYVLFDDEGHGFTRKSNQVYAFQRIVAFLDRYLKGVGTVTESGVANTAG